MRRTALARKTPLKPRSARTARLYRTLRVPLVRALLAEFPVCQFPGCTARAVDVHELRKRSQSGSITDRDNLRTSCRHHNEYAESEPRLCAELGWVRRAA